MTTQEVADRLVELCGTGQWGQAQDELYAENVKSIEPEGNPWGTVEGLAAVKEKGEKWSGMIEEFHGNTMSAPLVSKDYFVIRMQSDTTMKGMGRMQLDELCLYEVKDGKIVREQFFFNQ